MFSSVCSIEWTAIWVKSIQPVARNLTQKWLTDVFGYQKTLKHWTAGWRETHSRRPMAAVCVCVLREKITPSATGRSKFRKGKWRDERPGVARDAAGCCNGSRPPRPWSFQYWNKQKWEEVLFKFCITLTHFDLFQLLVTWRVGWLSFVASLRGCLSTLNYENRNEMLTIRFSTLDSTSGVNLV